MVCEWPGAKFDLLLKITSRTSSVVMSEKGRSVSWRVEVSGMNSWSRAGGVGIVLCGGPHTCLHVRPRLVGLGLARLVGLGNF